MNDLNPNPKLTPSNPIGFTAEQFISRYSPSQTSADLLEAVFVGREPLLQNVLEKVADSATSGATHHVLLYGPRGIGKSHFIALLNHRLVADEKLSDSVHIAWMHQNETTTSLVQLLVRIYRELCERYSSEYSVEWLDSLLDQPPEEIAGVLSRRLTARFEKRKLVILIENLDLLFENLGADGQHALRSLLQEHPFACLIATSQQLFKAVNDRSEPFFGFFQQIPLKPLTSTEAQQLLVKIAASKGQVDLVQFLNTPEGHSRVQAVYALAGGNHRVYVALSGYLTRDSLDQLTSPFQQALDDLTPFYQEQLHAVAPLQRQILQVLCQEPGTVNPKEIARRLLVDQRSIGKQVRILEEMGYLTSTKRGRETFYELREPLMRQAYENRERGSLPMLIEFLQIWYKPDKINTTEEWNNKATPLSDFDRFREALTYYEKAVAIDPTSVSKRFLQSEMLFAMHRWEEGFDSIREALKQSRWDDLGDVASMFSLIFRLSNDDAVLHTRIQSLVDLYQQARNSVGTTALSARPEINPLSHLGVGLVKSLANFDPSRITPTVLESYAVAVEQCTANFPEFEVPLRLFRYGIRYLISGKPSELTELIQPERRILQQLLGLFIT